MGELKNVPDDAKPVSPISEHMEEEEPKGKERAGPEDQMPGTALNQAERELLASTAENQRLREEANRGRTAMDDLRRQLREAHGREYDLQHPQGGSGGGDPNNGPPGGGGGGGPANPPPDPFPDPFATPFIRMPSEGGPKLASPPMFTGKPEEIDNFFTKCNLHIMGKPRNFPTENAKIFFALSYCEGTLVEEWVTMTTNDIVNFAAGSIVTYGQLRQVIEEQFGNPDKRRTAQKELAKLKQTGDCEQYVISFRIKAKQTGYDTEALVHLFKLGLKQGILRNLYTLQTMPTNLDGPGGWYEKAIMFDRNYREYLGYAEGRAPPPSPTWPLSSGTSRTRKCSSTPSSAPADGSISIN